MYLLNAISYALKMLMKSSPGANALAYLSGKSVTRKKVLKDTHLTVVGLMTLPNVIKLFFVEL